MKTILILLVLVLVLYSCNTDELRLKPNACFDVSPATDMKVGDTIKFSNCSVNANQYSWDFGDGIISTEASPDHVYKNSGSFTIKLEALNNEAIDIIYKTIQIKDKEIVVKKPNACFEVSSTTDMKVGKPIQFSNCSVNANKYTWDFGDGTNSTEASPDHVYKNSGNFKVKLEALNNEVIDIIYKTIQIKEEQIVVGIKENGAITSTFEPIVVKEIYGTSGKKIAFNGVDYFAFTKSFYVSHGDMKEHHNQYIGTLNGCTIHSLNGEPSIHALNDIVSPTAATFTSFDQRSFVGSGALYFVFKFKNEKNYMGWIKITSFTDLTIEDYCYYEVAKK
ncbi:MAG TPA: PKD domain-containing protein [Prolixibacteraceae bacterium]|nr:PKD domain-containing protein [Prolixibacteraceae bacterium]